MLYSIVEVFIIDFLNDLKLNRSEKFIHSLLE